MLLLAIFFFITSCSEEKAPEQKSLPVSTFSKLEISGQTGENSSFTLKAQKAFANNTNTLFKLENIAFFIKKNNKILYSISSAKGLYDKAKGSFNLDKPSGFTENKQFFIKSDNLKFLEKSNSIYANNVVINFSNHQINGKELTTDNELKNLTMKKVKATFRY